MSPIQPLSSYLLPIFLLIGSNVFMTTAWYWHLRYKEVPLWSVTRANMRFVPTKTPEQQSGLVLHRARHLFIRQQTSVINAIRAHLAEFGSLRRSGAMVSRNCLMSSLIRTTSEFPVCDRRAFCHPLRQDPWHQTSALAYGLAGKEADQGCGYRACQQNRADGLGHDGQGRAIQGTRRACAINEIAPSNWRDVKVGRANST
jgi:Putative member of DMT superfamily (DUF486)